MQFGMCGRQFWMNEVPVSGYTTAWPHVNETGIISISSQSKKHARKVCLYAQMHAEKEERQEHGKKKKTNYINFQVTIRLCR